MIAQKVKVFKQEIRKRSNNRKMNQMRYQHWLQTNPQLCQLRQQLYLKIGQCRLHCNNIDLQAIQEIHRFIDETIKNSSYHPSYMIVICQELEKYNFIGVMCRNLKAVQFSNIFYMLRLLLQSFRVIKDSNFIHADLQSVVNFWCQKLKRSCREQVLYVCLQEISKQLINIQVSQINEKMQRLNKIIEIMDIFIAVDPKEQKRRQKLQESLGRIGAQKSRIMVKLCKTLQYLITKQQNLAQVKLQQYINILTYLISQNGQNQVQQHKYQSTQEHEHSIAGSYSDDQHHDILNSTHPNQEHQGYHYYYDHGSINTVVLHFLDSLFMQCGGRIQWGCTQFRFSVLRLLSCLSLTDQYSRLLQFFLNFPQTDRLNFTKIKLQIIHKTSYQQQWLNYNHIQQSIQKLLQIFNPPSSHLFDCKAEQSKNLQLLLKSIFNIIINSQRHNCEQYYQTLYQICEDLLRNQFLDWCCQKWEHVDNVQVLVLRLLNVREEDMKRRVIRVSAKLMKWKQACFQLKKKVRLYLRLYGLQEEQYRCWDSEADESSQETDTESEDEEY